MWGSTSFSRVSTIWVDSCYMCVVAAAGQKLESRGVRENNVGVKTKRYGARGWRRRSKHVNMGVRGFGKS